MCCDDETQEPALLLQQQGAIAVVLTGHSGSFHKTAHVEHC